MALTEDTQEAARKMRKTIRGNARAATLFVGTGVSKGMTNYGSKGSELCDWTKLFKELATSLPDGCTERRLSESLGAQDSSIVILGLGHLIRARLENEGKWESSVREAIERIEQDTNKDAPWSRFFEALTAHSRNEQVLTQPLILTTNYDPLLSKALRARILTNPDLSDYSGLYSESSERSPRTAYQLWERDGSDKIPAHLTGVIEATQLWSLLRDGLLSPYDAFVHHLHGAAVKPTTVVFDAADYERTIQSQLWVEMARRLIRHDAPVIFAGVSASGLFDRHFSKMWELVGSDQRKKNEERRILFPRPRKLGYWLVEAGEKEAFETVLKEKEAEELILPGSIEIVTERRMEEGKRHFDWMPEWVAEALGLDDVKQHVVSGSGEEARQ